MRVQLIVADEHSRGRVIPINIPSFTIGRSEGCNLRSRNPEVSRYHCTIQVSNGVVIVQDLGGGNGTFVNGNRVTSVHTLKDGDKLTVGMHTLVVSIQAETLQPETNGNNFFELPYSASTKPPNGSKFIEHEQTEVITKILKPKKSAPEAEMMFDIRINGQITSVTKSQLFDLARKGSISPDDLVVVAGMKVFADSIQGIVFGSKSPTPSPKPPQPVAVSPQSAASLKSAPASTPTAPPAEETIPFDFADFTGTSSNSNPFDNIMAEPFVRIARRESSFGVIWDALDISFSRVYTIEGNNLVIHSLKALYYVISLVCLLGIFLMWLDVAVQCHQAKENALDTFYSYIFGVSVVTFGCVTIIVIVRVLLEMLLLTWLESARQEEQKNWKQKE